MKLYTQILIRRETIKRCKIRLTIKEGIELNVVSAPANTKTTNKQTDVELLPADFDCLKGL